MKKEYCLLCNNNVDIIIKDELQRYQDENEPIEFIGKQAYCAKCGERIYLEEIAKYNRDQLLNQIRLKNDIIRKEEIEEMLVKYNIGKRPLSLLLGFGEITITRYLSNYVPTKKNSDYLKKILNSPSEYYSLLQMNKDKINEIAFRKSEKKTKELLNINEEDKTIINVSRYIINNIEVTNMSLQKLLYYVQLFTIGIFNKPAFTSVCKAWKYGPVFGYIYYKYKKFDRCIIEDNQEIEEIDEDILSVVDAVIKYFGCFSGPTLMELAHDEKPWIEGTKHKDQIIEKNEMKKYAEKIINDYFIKDVKDIANYSNSVFSRYLNCDK